MSKQFKVAHARIDIVGLGGRDATPNSEFFRAALLDAWVPGTEVTRHRRTWKISGPRHLMTHVFSGHMGFVREGGLTTLDWDDEAQDFVRGEASSGVLVPFVIDTASGIVSFQLVPGEVRTNTVTTNLRALLNVNAPYLFIIEPLALPTTFETWRRSVSHVTGFSVRLDRPNPRYDGEKVEDLIEGLDAERVRLKASALAGGLDTTSPWFDQAMDHVRNGYGFAQIVGTEADSGEPTTYTESDQGGAVSLIDTIETDDDVVEASPDDLLSSMSRLPDSVIVEALDDDEVEDIEEA